MATRSRTPTSHLAGTADEIEVSFYESLQAGDIDRLMACWADEDDIVCVHPGGGRLLGAGEIRAAFEAMFANGQLRVQAEQVHRVDAMASSVHSVLERIEVATAEGQRTAWVVATNVYHRTAAGWRLVAHHASPGTLDTPPQTLGRPNTLH